jgi:hypothetical protein
MPELLELHMRALPAIGSQFLKISCREKPCYNLLSYEGILYPHTTHIRKPLYVPASTIIQLLALRALQRCFTQHAFVSEDSELKSLLTASIV